MPLLINAELWTSAVEGGGRKALQGGSVSTQGAKAARSLKDQASQERGRRNKTFILLLCRMKLLGAEGCSKHAHKAFLVSHLDEFSLVRQHLG